MSNRNQNTQPQTETVEESVAKFATSAAKSAERTDTAGLKVAHRIVTEAPQFHEQILDLAHGRAPFTNDEDGKKSTNDLYVRFLSHSKDYVNAARLKKEGKPSVEKKLAMNFVANSHNATRRLFKCAAGMLQFCIDNKRDPATEVTLLRAGKLVGILNLEGEQKQETMKGWSGIIKSGNRNTDDTDMKLSAASIDYVYLRLRKITEPGNYWAQINAEDKGMVESIAALMIDKIGNDAKGKEILYGLMHAAYSKLPAMDSAEYKKLKAKVEKKNAA